MPRFFHLSAILPLILAGCVNDPCAQISTCEPCATQYIEHGCRWCPRDNSCAKTSDDSVCSYSQAVTDTDLCTPTSGGSVAGSCTASYAGPTGDPQVSTQCQAVWNYRCRSNNQAAADQNWLVYDSLNATVACPYCSGAGGTGSSSSSSSGQTGTPANACNTAGVFDGCTAAKPYSCAASQYCWGSLGDCAADAACRR